MWSAVQGRQAVGLVCSSAKPEHSGGRGSHSRLPYVSCLQCPPAGRTPCLPGPVLSLPQCILGSLSLFLSQNRLPPLASDRSGA